MEQITRKGAHESPKVINPLVLPNCDECSYDPHRPTGEEVADIFRISQRDIDRVKRRFVEEGLESALGGRQGRREHYQRQSGGWRSGGAAGGAEL